MKRFLLAAMLALVIHGLFFGFMPSHVRRLPPVRPRFINISLASRPPARPGTSVRPGPVMEKKGAASRPVEKKVKPAVKPPLQRKPAKPAERPRPVEKPVVKKAAVLKKPMARQKKVAARPPEKTPVPPKRVRKPVKRTLKAKKPKRPLNVKKSLRVNKPVKVKRPVEPVQEKTVAFP